MLRNDFGVFQSSRIIARVVVFGMHLPPEEVQVGCRLSPAFYREGTNE